MTVESFLTDMEGYYGDSYGQAGRKIVGQYLSKLDDGLLPYIYAEVLKTVERRFKTAPGVAELEKVKRAARDEYKSDQARRQALEAPDRLQIAEDVLDPQAVAKVLERLALSKSVDK